MLNSPHGVAAFLEPALDGITEGLSSLRER
jgi:hypothetical protein